MLNEAPKKIKDYSHPTKSQLFWRVQGECWRRMITPFLMYMFMSLLALAVAALNPPFAATVVIDIFCILCGAAFNAHLAYSYGKMHYDSYVTGCLHRKNELFGIASGGNHRVEREYRPWKGFLIGFLVGVPVLVLGGLGAVSKWIAFLFFLFAWWSYIPVSWVLTVRQGMEIYGESYTISTLWAYPMIILPIVVTGVFYFVGAYINKRNRELGKLTKEQLKQKE